MLKKRMIGLMALALSAGLTLAACGDDNGNNGTNNGGNNGADAGNNGGTDGGNNGTPDGGNNGTSGLEGCEADNPPARCDQTFDDTTFGPGSVVTSFQVAGREVGGSTDPECCFDYTGDEEIDNALGATLLDFGQLESINDSLTESIQDGSLVLMFEHDGLTDLGAGETYALNFWLGSLGDDEYVYPGNGEDCTNETDDNGDGDVDCDDAACQFSGACTAPGEVCDSGSDDDGDGDVDCDDSDCANTAACSGSEVCGNGSDDDGDGDTDCADADCTGTSACIDTGETCDNGTDDDGDGAVDCLDLDCRMTLACEQANAIAIDPASVDAGTYPQARVPNATITDGALSAGPGTVQLSIDLLDTPLELRISNAQIEADVNDDDISDGVTLTNGKLGGVVRVSDIIDGLNGFAATCTCLGLEGADLVDFDPATNTGSCNAGTTEGDACNAAGEDTCGTIASNCDTLVSVLPLLADVDTDGDDSADAVSIGAKFETTGATFSGIAAE